MDYDLLDEAIHARAAALNNPESGDAWAIDARDDLRAFLARIREVVRAASCLAGFDCYDAETDAPDVRDAVTALTADDRRLLGLDR